MELLLTYAERIKTARLCRMKMYINVIHKESGKPRALLFCDMVWCFLRYGIGYLEYRTFGFVWQDRAHRATYMTMSDNHRISRRLNDRAKREIFEDKIAFLRRFAPLVKRDWLDLEASTPQERRAFAAVHPVCFAKTRAGFGGRGVERVELCAGGEDDVFRRLLAEGKTLVEEPIQQHPRMAALCSRSVNTLRIATILKDGEVHVMYTLARIGNGRGDVDNITSGGMYAPVGADGRIAQSAFCDKTGQYYDRHPVSGVEIPGFEVPLYRESIALVQEAARVVPEVRYVGWDVALTASGPLLVEGNTLPGFYIRQNYRHLGEKKQGAKPDFIAVLGEEF